jgi:hypothetical protein
MRHITLGRVSIVVTLVAVAVLCSRGGGRMFTPGALSGHTHTTERRGGVMSHAELSNNCGACHAPPWSKQTMASRCVTCHTEVDKQLEAGTGLHGRMPGGNDCRRCHTEHNGAHAEITNLASFDHNWTSFALTGAHRTVECGSCHQVDGRLNYHHEMPQSCVGCHDEPSVHKGQFGLNCEQCHKTETWKGAVFNHRFPINHGSRRRQNTCATCHSDESNYQSYTCYNCHEHTVAKMERIHRRRNVVDLSKCADCHMRRGKRRERDRAEIDGEMFAPKQVASAPLGALEMEELLALLGSKRVEHCPGCEPTRSINSGGSRQTR